jgi:hypothetical protein
METLIMRNYSTAAFAALLLTLAIGTPQAVVAQTKAAAPATAGATKQPALNDLDCRTLLRLSGDERAFTILYMHGFISGKTNQLLLPADELAATTDKIIDHCIDKPNDKLLAVFEQYRKAR